MSIDRAPIRSGIGWLAPSTEGRTRLATGKAYLYRSNFLRLELAQDAYAGPEILGAPEAIASVGQRL